MHVATTQKCIPLVISREKPMSMFGKHVFRVCFAYYEMQPRVELDELIINLLKS